MLDVFKGDAFSIISLTDAINKLKFVPGRLSASGLFISSAISTTTVSIEEKDGVLKLVAPSPRGAPGETMDKSKRTMRSLVVPHFEINDAVYAEEVQNVRPFGQESGLEVVQTKVMERMGEAGASLMMTLEHARVGAVIGVITYADASTLNLFTEFGVSQEGEIDFDLDNATPAAGALRKKCAGVYRQVAGILDGVPFSGLRALCGDNFFDDLLAHPEVRATYDGWSEAKILREGYIEANGQSYGAFEFGGIVWENYRGSYGGTPFVNSDKCHIFPEGVPGLFRTVFAPADYVDTVNTLGRPMYSKQYPMENGKGVNLDTQMNALNYCTRPKSLIKGKRT
jgi:hypothetical protein